MRWTGLAIGLVVLAGCTEDPLGYSPAGAGVYRSGSLASLSGQLGGQESEFRWSPRGGLVLFLGTDEKMDPRPTVGGYTRLLESNLSRIEVAIEVTPDMATTDKENTYISVTGDFAYFPGEGSLSLKAGAGTVFEFRNGETYLLGIFEAGVGLWSQIGKENAFVANAMLQIPLGDANPAVMLAVTAGYEF